MPAKNKGYNKEYKRRLKSEDFPKYTFYVHRANAQKKKGGKLWELTLEEWRKFLGLQKNLVYINLVKRGLKKLKIRLIDKNGNYTIDNIKLED